ncbi:hypothetical protein D3C86_555190 [compost metagenome]
MAQGAGGNRGHAQDHVREREQRHAGRIGQDRVDRVGGGVGVATLLGVFGIVAGAGDPVERAGLAGEAEFLIPGPVLFPVVGVEIQVRPVGAVLVLAVLGGELSDRGQGGEINVAEGVGDGQDAFVEAARLVVVDDVVEDALLERVGIVRRIGRVGGQAGRRRNRRDADRRARILVDLVMRPAQDRLGPGRDVPAQGGARRPVVFAVIVLAGRAIDQPAVAAVHQGVDPQGHGVVDRQVDQALEAALVVLAEAKAQPGFEVVAGLVGGDGHGAGGAVAAEQGALRSLQDFDSRDIAERQQGRARSGRIDAVDIDADRRVGADAEVRRRDPADIVARLSRAGVRDRQARHEGGDVAHVVRSQRLQR